MFDERLEGDLLMDAPLTQSWGQPCAMAAGKKEWRAKVRRIKDMIRMTTRTPEMVWGAWLRSR